MKSRTIRPSFFDNETLYDAEASSGLPLRVAFAGLWCYADREGRFKWESRRIKAAILPHDDVDGEKVLNILADAGFIRKYNVDNAAYGYIPTFLAHQPIHKHETPSKLPPPPDLPPVSPPLPPLYVEEPTMDDDRQTERPSVTGNNSNSSRGRGEGKGVQGEIEKPSVREILMAEPGGAKALGLFCKTVEHAEDYLEIVGMALDGAYGGEFRITPGEAVIALTDWAVRRVKDPSPKALRGFLKYQVRERNKDSERAQTARGKDVDPVETFAARLERPA